MVVQRVGAGQSEFPIPIPNTLILDTRYFAFPLLGRHGQTRLRPSTGLASCVKLQASSFNVLLGQDSRNDTLIDKSEIINDTPGHRSRLSPHLECRCMYDNNNNNNITIITTTITITIISILIRTIHDPAKHSVPASPPPLPKYFTKYLIHDML